MIAKVSKVTHNLADLPAEVLISHALQHDHSVELVLSYPRPLYYPAFFSL